MKLDDFVERKKGGATTKPVARGKKEAKHVDVPDSRKIELLQRILKEKQLHKERDPIDVGTLDFVDAVEKFAAWVRARTYIRGDIEAMKQQLANLVALDPSITTPFQKQQVPAFLDMKDFLRQAKQHDSLHPDEPVLTRQSRAALARKDKGEKLSSTDYHHVRLLKELVKNETRKAPFWAFLDEWFKG